MRGPALCPDPVADESAHQFPVKSVCRPTISLFLFHQVRYYTYMDLDLENIILQAVDDALAGGYDYMAQTVLAVQAVQRARPDVTAADALAHADAEANA